MKKVVILESLAVDSGELDRLQRPLEERGFQFVRYARTDDEQENIRRIRDADAVILANMPLSASVIRAGERLQFIDVAFTGVDHLDMAAARDRGIVVSNASGYSNEAVSELVLGMTLSLLRHIPQVQQRCREGGTREGLIGTELRGKTVGVIGYGNIGRRTGELFHAFGTKVLAQCRHIRRDLPDYVEQVSQEELLARSDVVVLHCPLNSDTCGMIDYEKLCRMKPTAILINAARGPVTNEDDLARALNEGVIAGAGVDVFTREPPLPPDTQLLLAKNTLVTPHVAFATWESMSLRARIVFDNLRAWADGTPVNVV